MNGRWQRMALVVGKAGSRRRTALFGLLLAAVYLLPRLWAYWGIQHTWQFDFGDTLGHLANLQRLLLQPQIDPTARPFDQFPGVGELFKQPMWPPGVYWLSALWARFFGVLSLWTTQLLSALTTVLVVAGLLLQGRALDQRRGLSIGLWAALFSLLCPALVGASWYYALDYPLTGVVALALGLLWRTRGLTHQGYTLAFGLCSLAGLLVKVTFPVFVAGPLLVTAVSGLRRAPSRRARSRVWSNVVLLGAVVLGGHVALQPTALPTLWDIFLLHLSHQPMEHMPLPLPPMFSLAWAAGVVVLLVFGFPWPALLPALPGLVGAHLRRVPLPGRLFWLSALWLPLLLFTVMINKMERYLFPIYPLLALLGAWGLHTLLPRRARTPALAGAALLMGATLVASHITPGPWIGEGVIQRTYSFMWDMRLPSAAQLATLRRFGYTDQADLRPLRRVVAEMVRADRRAGAIAVAAKGSTGELPDGVSWTTLRAFGALFAAEAGSGRYTFEVDAAPEDETHPWVLQPPLAAAPSLLLVHSASLRLERFFTGLTLVERLPLRVPTTDLVWEGTVSLFHTSPRVRLSPAGAAEWRRLPPDMRPRGIVEPPPGPDPAPPPEPPAEPRSE